MFDRFTDRARKLIAGAQVEADRFHHDYIGTEHLLLGLIRAGDGVALIALRNLGMDPDQVRSDIDTMVQSRAGGKASMPLPFTPQAKRVLEGARDEADHLGHPYIGSEHILLALLGEPASVAFLALRQAGLEPDAIRAEIVDLLGHAPATGSAAAPQQRPPTIAESASVGITIRALDQLDLTIAEVNKQVERFLRRSPPVPGKTISIRVY